MLMQQNIRRSFTGALVCISALFSIPAFAYMAYIDHPTSYASGDCHNANNDACGDTTDHIRTGLAGMGWDISHFYTGDQAWATDFIDCSITSGEDCYNADTAQVAIYDGHGQTGVLGFSYSHSGICNAYADQSQIELNQTTALFISATCCFMNLAYPQNFTQHNGLNQQLGFGSLASWDSDSMGDYFNASATSNTGWLDRLEDKPSWFTGDNTTVVFTRGWNLTDVNNNRSTCGLKRRTCWDRKGYTVGSAWQYDYIDHGNSGCW